jgi:HK97 family phage major capsid protein
MPTTQQLREKRANVWDQMQAIMARAESGELSAEDRSAYDAAEADLDRVGEDLERQERHEAREREYSTLDRRGVVDERAPGTPAGEGEESRYAGAFTSWMRRGTTDISTEERTALRGGWVDGSELRAQGVATAAAGGYLVPPAFRAKLIEAMQFVAPMRQYAEVITTDTGANLPWPTADDSSNEGAILGENTQVTEQDAVFGQSDIGAHMYTSKLVRVSQQLLQDNAFGLESWLAGALGRRIGRVQNRHFTVGTGTGQPKGLVTAAPVGKEGAAGQVTSITYDDLVDLTESLDLAYANGLGWMFSQSARKVIRKLKDGNNRPLWEPSVQAGTPDTLMGYGIAINNHVPAPAAGAKSVLFGDIKTAYLVRDVSGFQLLRLQERYAEYLQVGFLGFQRSDGTVQDAAAVRAYQHPAA